MNEIDEEPLFALSCVLLLYLVRDVIYNSADLMLLLPGTLCCSFIVIQCRCK